MKTVPATITTQAAAWYSRFGLSAGGGGDGGGDSGAGVSLISHHHAGERRQPPPFGRGGGWLLATGRLSARRGRRWTGDRRRRLTGSGAFRAGRRDHRPGPAMVALVEHRAVVVSVMPVVAVVAAHPAAGVDTGDEDRRDDEDDPGDDGDPGGEPVEPVGLLLDGRRGRGVGGLGCFAHG